MSIKAITIFFSILPLIAAFLDYSLLKYVPFFVLFILFLLIISVNKKISKIPISYFIIISITLIHFLIQLTFGYGYGSGGIILLLLESFLIYQFIIFNKKIDLENIISFFLKFSLFYLYFEFFIRLLGFEYKLVELFGYAESVAKFKTYNTAPWYILELGFKGLNSFFLGSQIAGILSLLTLIYFLGRKFYLKQNNFKLNILIILSLIMYLITTTQTCNLLLLIILIFTFFFVPSFFGLKNISVRLFLFYVIGISIFFFFEIIFTDIIFFKLNEQKDIDIYISLLIDPYNEYLKLNLDQVLLGTGRLKWDYDATSDLGFFGILFRVGLPYFVAISLFIFFCIIKSFKLSLNKENSNYLNFHLLICGYFIFIFWGSLIHYTSSVELGCREIFAFQIAYFFKLQKNIT